MNRPVRLVAALACGLVLACGAALAANRSASNYGTAGGAVTRIGGTLEVMPGGVFRLDRATKDDGTADAKTATAVAGAATLNKLAGIVTSEALTTASGAAYTLAITNSRVAVGDQVFASVASGTNTAGGPQIGTVTAGAGVLTVLVRNDTGPAAAFNGTLAVTFMVLKN